MGNLFDYSINELFAPQWLDEETCACTEGVMGPVLEADVLVKLVKSTAFGTGGHPVTTAVFRELKELIASDDNCFKAHESEIGRPRILEVDAGSGLLLFLAKKLNKRLKLSAVIAPEETDILWRNQRWNKIKRLEQILFSEFATHDSLPKHKHAFDLIFTQRGQYNWKTSFDIALGHFHHCLAPSGKLIYSGFPHAELPLALHIFGEFFHVMKVSIERGWPVLVGCPR